MSEKNKYEAGFGSDALKNPQRIVFTTKKTSAKVQDLAEPKVMSYPHLLMREAIVFQVIVAMLVVVSLLWDAPLEQLANPLLTPNPAKAPWYFLGLQELLHYFPPLVAGVIIPTLVVLALIVIPYFNVNISGAPLWAAKRIGALQGFVAVLVALVVVLGIYDAWTVLVPTVLVGGLAVYSYFFEPKAGGWKGYLRGRPISWWVMTWFIAVSIVLTLVGTFFRGPGWSWVWPWRPYGA